MSRDAEIELLESWLTLDFGDGVYPPNRELRGPLSAAWMRKIDNVFIASYSPDQLAEFRRIRNEWRQRVD